MERPDTADSGTGSEASSSSPSFHDDGNVERVAVHVRVRPSSDRDRCLDLVSGDSALRAYPNGQLQGAQTFSFDGVMDEFTPQEEVYSTVVAPLIPGLFEGKSAAVVCYGQTGSGKTHTMMGDMNVQSAGGSGSVFRRSAGHGLHPEAGVAPRVCAELFQRVDAMPEDITVTASFLEIYCEKIHDLLRVHETPVDAGRSVHRAAQKRALDITGGASSTVTVKDATCIKIGSAREALALLERGMGARVTAATKCNSSSSRGHAIFVLTVDTPTTLGRFVHGQFYLCDLAGSEKLKKTEAEGLRMQEAAKINTSLLSLHLCIDRLAARDRHVPYRNSKLTRLLQNALGGSGRAAVICTVHPSHLEAEETMSTLRFGRTASTVENHVVANVSLRSCYEWQQLLLDAFTTIRRLKLDMSRLKAGAGRDGDGGDGGIAGLFTGQGGYHGADTASWAADQPAVEGDIGADGWPASAGQEGLGAVYLDQPQGRSRRRPQMARKIPASTLECPITGARFTTPVVAADGYTYERSALASHFAAEETEIDASVGAAAITSPITGEPLGTMVTFPNRQLIKLMSAQDHAALPDRYLHCLVTAGDDVIDGRIGLPADCLALVLSYIHGPDLVACSMACRRLRAAAAADWLWTGALRLDFPSLRTTGKETALLDPKDRKDRSLPARPAIRQAWLESAKPPEPSSASSSASSMADTGAMTSALTLYKYKVTMCPRAWRFRGRKSRNTPPAARTLPTPPAHLKLHFNARKRSAGKGARRATAGPN